MDKESQEKASRDKKMTIESRQSGLTFAPKTEPTKRKTFNINDAVKTLDLALGRLKKSKFVNGEKSSVSVPTRQNQAKRSPDMFMDISGSTTNVALGLDNASLMSMNFSHYELMRNLSCSTSNSEGTFSGTTRAYTPDHSLRNEHLEKFFRSAEMWTRKSSPNNVRFDVQEK